MFRFDLKGTGHATRMRKKKTMKIRTAVREDASNVCKVVRASIEQLCEADHHGDKAILDQWLANKTPETVARWFGNPDNINLVAVDDNDTILAAGCIRRDGTLLLNYVSPEARFRGISTCLLAALEDAARSAGNARCALESTKTAHGFYQKRGYSDVGEPGSKFGLTTFPMQKML
jgi:GNAT superfamily N-acetyltransferase